MTDAMINLLWDIIDSDRFEDRIGGILQKILDAKLDRQMALERFDKDLGQNVVEKQDVNVLDFIAHSMPQIQGAIRGCQKDSAEARNRAAQARDQSNLTTAMIGHLGKALEIAFRQQTAEKARQVIYDATCEIEAKCKEDNDA